MANDELVKFEKEIVADFLNNLTLWIAAECYNVSAVHFETRQYNARQASMQERAIERKMRNWFGEELRK